MEVLVEDIPPCVLHEDEHLLVVHKPPGLNTHSPAPFAGEGIYEWLRNRERRWADLAIVHRLDKETSGVLAFAKTTLASRSLTQQFEERAVRKVYVLLTNAPIARDRIESRSSLVRAGDKYLDRPVHAGSQIAETLFTVRTREKGLTTLQAEPRTGRTHQIRVHAAAAGFPILGDTLYAGAPWPRLCLHAESIAFKHPATLQAVTFQVEAHFDEDPANALRAAIIDPTTDCYRLCNGAADNAPTIYVELYGKYILMLGEWEAVGAGLEPKKPARGVYFKRLSRRARGKSTTDTSPRLLAGEPAPAGLTVSENRVKYEISFGEGYSVGIFLDQRDNRRRLLMRHIAAGFDLPEKPIELLNTFSYTCAFSVAAALGGARTTSLDLSKKYLEWGKRNFALNGIDSSVHDFIYGDAFDWMRRLARKERLFDVVILDPPTFSQSKESGVFQAEKDYGKLVATALPLLRKEGVLFASTNAARLAPEDFLDEINAAIRKAGRTVLQTHYVPQPIDFPISREEPAYLKTVWLRMA